MTSKLSLFFAELRRRKVTRVAAVYTLVGLGVIEGASMVLPTLQLQGAYDYIVILVIFGFPVALVLAWALEVTPDGIRRTPDLTAEELAAQRPTKLRPSNWVTAGIGFVVVLAAAYFVFFRGEHESSLPEAYVAVFPFENLTGDPDLDDLGPLVAAWATAGLSRVPEIRQVAANTVEEALSARGDSAAILETARHLRVGLAVTGVIARSGDQLEIRAEITRVADGDLVQSVYAQGDAGDPSQVVAELGERVMGALAVLFDEFSQYAPDAFSPTQPPAYEAFQSFRRGRARYLALDFSGAARLLEDSFRQDSTWFPSAIFLSVVYRLTREDEKRAFIIAWLDSHRLDMDPIDRANWDLLSAREDGDWETLLEVTRSGFRTDPASGWMDLAATAMSLGRPEEALQALGYADADDPLWRDFPVLRLIRPWANHLLGRHQEELDAARQGRERFPEFMDLRRAEIRALVAMNRLDEIGPLLDQVEVMEPDGSGMTPGNVIWSTSWTLARFGHREESLAAAERALRWFRGRDPDGYLAEEARILIFTDRASEALTILGPLVAASPDSMSIHGLHGLALAITGDREEAEAEERWLEELDRPGLLGYNTLWRAGIVAHLGRKDESVRLLRQASREGLHYIEIVVDPWLEPLWDYEPYQQLIAPKG